MLKNAITWYRAQLTFCVATTISAALNLSAIAQHGLVGAWPYGVAECVCAASSLLCGWISRKYLKHPPI